MPGISLRTTMLVGHPGEDEEAFEELMAFVEAQRFERLGVFTYSHEEGTYAYSMEDAVPRRVKEQRAARLMTLQEEISHSHNLQKVGTALRVLVDRMESGHYIARSESDSPEVDNEVIIDGKGSYLRIGDFAQVRIERADEFDLYAIPY